MLCYFLLQGHVLNLGIQHNALTAAYASAWETARAHALRESLASCGLPSYAVVAQRLVGAEEKALQLQVRCCPHSRITHAQFMMAAVIRRTC